jgi:hypothetical protein
VTITHLLTHSLTQHEVPRAVPFSGGEELPMQEEEAQEDFTTRVHHSHVPGAAGSAEWLPGGLLLTRRHVTARTTRARVVHTHKTQQEQRECE